MPDPDSFCRSYFCYGTSIRSLKSTRAALHTDPIPAELPLPVVLQQSLPAAFLPLPAFQRFLPPQLLWLAQGSAFRLEQPLELVSQSLSVLVFRSASLFSPALP